jgi:hypothetical protein
LAARDQERKDRKRVAREKRRQMEKDILENQLKMIEEGREAELKKDLSKKGDKTDKKDKKDKKKRRRIGHSSSDSEDSRRSGHRRRHESSRRRRSPSSSPEEG